MTARETMTPKAVLSDDTTAAAEDLQVRRWREMTPEEKGALNTGLSQTASAMTWPASGIATRWPRSARSFFAMRFSRLARNWRAERIQTLLH